MLKGLSEPWQHVLLDLRAPPLGRRITDLIRLEIRGWDYHLGAPGRMEETPKVRQK